MNAPLTYLESWGRLRIRGCRLSVGTRPRSDLLFKKLGGALATEEVLQLLTYCH